MLDAQAIIEQVRTGTAPQSWQIYRAKWSNDPTDLMMFVGVALIVGVYGPTWLRKLPQNPVWIQVILVILALFIAGGLVGQVYFLTIKWRSLPSWILVLTPDGVVQYVSGVLGNTLVVPFSSAHISTVGGVATLWVRQRRALSNWQPNRVFGKRQVIMSQVLTAFDAYTARQREAAQHV